MAITKPTKTTKTVRSIGCRPVLSLGRKVRTWDDMCPFCNEKLKNSRKIYPKSLQVEVFIHSGTKSMVAIVVSCVRRFLTFCLDDLQRGDSCLEAETRHQSPTISGNNCPTCYSDICILAFMAEVCVVSFRFGVKWKWCIHDIFSYIVSWCETCAEKVGWGFKTIKTQTSIRPGFKRSMLVS